MSVEVNTRIQRKHGQARVSMDKRTGTGNSDRGRCTNATPGSPTPADGSAGCGHTTSPVDTSTVNVYRRRASLRGCTCAPMRVEWVTTYYKSLWA